MPKTSFFVTGTDTDSGKTAVAGGILALAAQHGLRTLAMKPIASGCHQTLMGCGTRMHCICRASSRNPSAMTPSTRLPWSRPLRLMLPPWTRAEACPPNAWPVIAGVP